MAYLGFQRSASASPQTLALSHSSNGLYSDKQQHSTLNGIVKGLKKVPVESEYAEMSSYVCHHLSARSSEFSNPSIPKTKSPKESQKTSFPLLEWKPVCTSWYVWGLFGFCSRILDREGKSHGACTQSCRTGGLTCCLHQHLEPWDSGSGRAGI